MKSSKALVVVLPFLVLLVNFIFGQEFEGSAETGLGDGRLVEFSGDKEIPFIVSETATATFTRKIANCALLNLPFLGFSFKGTNFDKCYVCANGLVRFKDFEYQVNPRAFGTYTAQNEDPCFAPYWALVDLDSFTNGQSKVVFHKYEDAANDPRGVFTKATEYGNKILGKTDYEALWVTIITWHNIRPNNLTGVVAADYGGRNTFQLFLANNDANEAFVVYLYEDIDWSVGVLLNELQQYQDSSHLPVVGWDSGRKDDLKRYDNFADSGSVLVEIVDDFLDPVLEKRGEIGIDLTAEVVAEPTSEELCRAWVSKQYAPGGLGRQTCTLPCAPTFRKLDIFLSAVGRWGNALLFSRFKAGLFGTTSFCVFNIPGFSSSAFECCYDLNFGYYLDFPFPGSGRAHPNFFTSKYFEEETAYDQCCIQSGLDSCDLFFSVRPPCSSRRWRLYSRIFRGVMFGDPHFVTLDGKNYTFNGCGWFTYFKGEIPGQNKSTLLIQVRTTRVGDVNATGFTGIAVKEGSSETIQVNLRPTGGLLVRVAGEDYALSGNATTLASGISLSFVNETFGIGTPLGNGIQIKEAANGTFFTFVTAFSPTYQNFSVGLSGKWNGDMDDDFTIPDGTVLPINLNDSEIFHRFGEEWRVPDNEIIYENIDDDHAKYVCPSNFVPVFLDQALADLDPSLRAQADQVCGNDITCLFDIAATHDVSIGQSTLSEVTTINNEIALADNRVPVFTRNLTAINVTLGETFVLLLEAEDDDGDVLEFDVPNIPAGATFNYTGNRFYFSWDVNSVNEANLTFLVKDTKNGTSTLTPIINFCRCLNGGECFIPPASSDQVAAIVSGFVVMSCNCPLGKTGQFCGETKDFCLGGSTPPCHPLVTCTNNPTNFTCGPCPNGYDGEGEVCTDTNECARNLDTCDQVCTNTVGSYSCGCNSGFNLNADERRCDDVDECSLANDCSQLCNNTVGSFECFCRIGFKIVANDTKSCEAQTECGPSNACAHICYINPLVPGEEKCECRIGFRLGSNQQSCEDVDECLRPQDNLCDHICENTEGSYTCSCLPGYQLQDSGTTCQDIDECFTNADDCNGQGEECENIAGGFRCECSKKLNMIRVNSTCIFKVDETIKEDLAPQPPTATTEQQENAIRITLFNYQVENYTIDADTLFKESVVKLLNDFCNANSLRPQDCGVDQNAFSFNDKSVERLPGFPMNDGDNAVIEFYVDYPSSVKNASLPKAILASVVSAELQTLERLTGFDIRLDTSVTPDAPATPSQSQSDNAVTLQISSFTSAQWTTFFDTVFRRAVAVTINRYCEMDEYSRTEDCELTGDLSFDLDDIGRMPTYPQDSGNNVLVSFYVNKPDTTDPLPQRALASMLKTRESDLETALSQQVDLQTSADPLTPPTANADQTSNSIEIRISSFSASQWTYLHDLRLRRSIASRVKVYCGGNAQHLVDCQITGNQAAFNESDVRRTSASTPSDSAGNNIDYSFYVNYPGQETPVVRYILASIAKIELDAMQLESGLFFSLVTSFAPPAPGAPNAAQSENVVEIKIVNQEADQWHGIQDNRLRAAVAAQVASYCTANLVVCGVTSDQVSFDSSHVTRISSSPVQDGDNATYTLFVDYPSGSGPIQHNLLSGILTVQIDAIEAATSLDLEVQSSTLAADPPVETADQASKAVVVAAIGMQASQWSAIQDNKFRGYVAHGIAEYCTASEAQAQDCEIPGNNAVFAKNHVQRVQGSPTQNGADAEIEFYVQYPDSGTMSQEILVLIMSVQLTSIGTNAGLTLELRTTIETETPPPPTVDNTANAIDVVLTDFTATEWPVRDTLFRENMAQEINAFCVLTTFHRDICNISDIETNGFTSNNIQRLPNSPRQNGSNSILSFYATLPSGSGSLPKSVLGTIFTTNQDRILSLNSELQNPLESVSTGETPVLTSEQEQNKVPVSIMNFPIAKITSLVIIDIKVTIASRMNTFCFSTPGDVCGLATTTRRKKRAVGDPFTQNDVVEDVSSIMDAGNNTVLSVVVNEPGTNNPVSSSVVDDALHQTLQENGQSDISNLTLAVVNAPTPTNTQTNNAISVRLPNTQASQWELEEGISFRRNLSQAIVAFCGQSDIRLDLCNLTRNQLSSINFLNVQTLPGSPTQDGADAILSFFVELPSGTMSAELLSTIFNASPNVITVAQPEVVVNATSQNPTLTTEQADNLVELRVDGGRPSQDVRLDVQVTIANRLNEYCQNNTGASICPTTRNFTKDDVLVRIDVDGSVSFVVNNPDNGNPISASGVQDAISGPFTSDLLRLTFTVPASAGGTEKEVDWPLILGLSIGGALLFLFVVISVVIGVVNNSKSTTFKEYSYDMSKESVYSARGWQFERDSPYSGSPFASIDAIPGFDEDGLPTRPQDTNV